MQGYRSKAIELEVRLREQLAEAGVQGGDGMELPPSAALTGGGASSMATRPGGGDGAGGGEVSNAVTAPKLQVYSDLFEAIIETDDAFAPLLQKVKAIYDACAEPYVQGGEPKQERSLTPNASGDGDSAVGADRLAELSLENRLLRTMAGRLHNQRLELRAERQAQAAEARRKQKQMASDTAGEDWAVLAGLLPMGGGMGCQDWLQRKTPLARPFSAMRITSHGVRTDQVW